MCFLFSNVQTLNIKECHSILLPCDSNLYYAVRHFYHHKIAQSLFSLTIKDHTYLGAIFIALCTNDNLLEGSYSIHMYVLWTLMARNWFKGLDAQVVFLLSAKFWLAKDYEQASHVRGSMTI